MLNNCRNIVTFNKVMILLLYIYIYTKSDKAGFIKPLQRIRGTYYRKILKTNKEMKCYVNTCSV